eukprot:Blabericola_migrator_1__1967@NODE_1537_length_4324_cov_94_076110_g1010_i0_p4_GENE_NODE_1537_length_4324_cov_94_076110_g1010_i0NODE_1537_length_4324_cov_94_076110_g1010_i0_p4_ORF_typecomplete_len113_score2_07_NODE_1537_length_4324_cov_94_076110_g1010_i029413279
MSPTQQALAMDICRQAGIRKRTLTRMQANKQGSTCEKAHTRKYASSECSKHVKKHLAKTDLGEQAQEQTHVKASNQQEANTDIRVHTNLRMHVSRRKRVHKSSSHHGGKETR